MTNLISEDERILAMHREMEKSRAASEATKRSAETKGPTIWAKLAILAGLLGLVWYSATHELVVVKAQTEEKSLSGVPLLLVDGEGHVRDATTTAFGTRIFLLNNRELDGARITMMPKMGNTQLVNGSTDGAIYCLDSTRIDLAGGCRTVYESNDVNITLTGFSAVESGFWRTLTAEFEEVGIPQ